MLINRKYIINQASLLIEEKQNSKQIDKAKADKLYAVKRRFPEWLRNIIFHPFNPAYSVYLQYKASKNKGNNWQIESLYPFAYSFLQYFEKNDIQFETNDYYPQEDNATIQKFVENRVKSFVPGYTQASLSKEQVDMYKQRKKIFNSVKRKGAGYSLSLDGENYYLPVNLFEEHTYIHEYGLKYLPEHVCQYIADKAFLDIGSYLGDTAILLAKKYAPSHIYAYEPVTANVAKLEETIAKNATDKITAVQKGIGDKEMEMDIYIHPDHLSSSSTNENIACNDAIKETIKITTIDRECKDKNVGLIKMDIEGAEFSAIVGGLETIKRDKPVLLISLYHTAKDFFEIPPMLKAAVPEYDFRFLNIEIVNPFLEKILVAYPRA